MSSSAFSFSRRTFGRAPSPPTWACYEQIPIDDDDSDTGSEDDSCSEDEEDYGRPEHDHECSNEDFIADHGGNTQQAGPEFIDKMDVVDDREREHSDDAADFDEIKKDIKGKQRAIEPEVDDSPKRRQRRKKHRETIHTLRPILTIHKSQGFVWNQDLFVPPYIKDRYVASTSPPNSCGFVSTSASLVNCLNDYEVDVVEIRVKEGELANIIP